MPRLLPSSGFGRAASQAQHGRRTDTAPQQFPSGDWFPHATGHDVSALGTCQGFAARGAFAFALRSYATATPQKVSIFQSLFKRSVRGSPIPFTSMSISRSRSDTP